MICCGQNDENLSHANLSTAMIKLYGIRNCDNCRKAQHWLQDRAIEFGFTDIRNESLEEALLKKWQEQLGWELLLNKQSITWRKIPAFDRTDLDAGNARHLILNYPTVLKRPVLDLGNRVVIGFDEKEYEALDL